MRVRVRTHRTLDISRPNTAILLGNPPLRKMTVLDPRRRKRFEMALLSNDATTRGGGGVKVNGEGWRSMRNTLKLWPCTTAVLTKAPGRNTVFITQIKRPTHSADAGRRTGAACGRLTAGAAVGLQKEAQSDPAAAAGGAQKRPAAPLDPRGRRRGGVLACRGPALPRDRHFLRLRQGMPLPIRWQCWLPAGKE